MYVLEIEPANIALSPAANIAINIGPCGVNSVVSVSVTVSVFVSVAAKPWLAVSGISVTGPEGLRFVCPVL